MDDIRAVTMGSAPYFLGVVALLNSLRITGNTMPLLVLDTGMEAWQRELLAAHCEISPARPGVAPYLQKPNAASLSGADITVFLDSDIIVTGPLTSMVEAAASGKVAIFTNQEDDQRWFAEWHELFALRAPLRRAPYMNSGAVALSRVQLPDLLPRWAELCERMVGEPVMSLATTGRDYPFWLADQDALNALLQSEVPADSVVCFEPPGMILGPTDLSRTAVDDLASLACSWGGQPVTLLHAVGLVKPWQRRARRELRRTAYLACLRRALSGPDLELRVPTRHLPLWLRPGLSATAAAWVLHGYDAVARPTRTHRQRLGLASGRPAVGANADAGEPPTA